MNTKHTPGPWKVLADPVHAGSHPYHDSRFISTGDASVEWNARNPREWRLESGSIICTMRDIDPANARLIAAAPELLAALEGCLQELEDIANEGGQVFVEYTAEARAAIAKAKGEQ